MRPNLDTENKILTSRQKPKFRPRDRGGCHAKVTRQKPKPLLVSGQCLTAPFISECKGNLQLKLH